MILPIKYQVQVLQMLHDGQGHYLVQKCFYWNTMYKDLTEYRKSCPQFQVAKGYYVGPKTKLGSIITNGPLDLLCVDFKKGPFKRR